MIQLEEATIADLQKAMDADELTSLQLIQAYLARIGQYDQSGPQLHSVLEINPDAEILAAALDDERRKSGRRGPLHGIPLLLKDNINTKDKMHTSAGALALGTSCAPRDAYVAEKLRSAGVIILGKVHMTEFACFMAEDMPVSYCSRGGYVQNPYGDFSPGGSSSGSGVAAAANLAAATVGTETSGSIIDPASRNALVGIKPTLGLVSRSGVVPISLMQDTVGPLARTVADAAAVLGAMAGPDERDRATWTGAKRSYTNYAAFLDKDGLRGARIGVPRKHYSPVSLEQRNLFNQALQVMADLGATIVDQSEIPTANEVGGFPSKALIYEFKVDINAYLAALGPARAMQNLADIIRFNQAHAQKALRYGQDLLLAAEATSGTLTEPEYIRARRRDLRLAKVEGIDLVMKEHHLDALVFAAEAGAHVCCKAGYPAITVPGGFSPEPMGITFVGQAYTEPMLIGMAYAFEQATKHRVAPDLA